MVKRKLWPALRPSSPLSAGRALAAADPHLTATEATGKRQLWLWIDPTRRCNLACKLCYTKQSHAREDLSPEDFELIRSELVRFVAGPGFSSTFGWTPLACAAANATLDVLEEERLPLRAKQLGELATKRLRPLIDEISHVADVRAYGLEIGVELVNSKGDPLSLNDMLKLSRALLAHGVFAEPSHYTSTLLIMPPLTIPEEQLLQALDIVVEAIRSMDITE
jgi:hypothetical protein